MSQSGRYVLTGGTSTINSLTGNAGGAVGPTGGNVDILGSGEVTVTGNPGTSTLTISLSGAVSDTFQADVGSAVPALGILNVLGGSNIATAGAGSTITINLDGTTDHAIQLGNAGGTLTSLAVGATGTVLIGNTGADPSFSATPSITSITIANAPVAGTDGANKAYVDLIAAGFTFQSPAFAATTAALTTVYANGAAGVGATLTNAGAMAAFSVDGVSPVLNARVLVKDQATTFENGIYTLTTVGDGVTNWVLTRATSFDQPAEIQPGEIVPVTDGTVNANTLWLQTETVAAIGVDPILFVGFLSQGITSLVADAGATTGTIVTVAGGSNIATSAAGATLTINVDGTTDHAVQVGNAGASLTSLAVGTTGQVLIGATGADPAFGALGVNSALTNHGVLLGQNNAAIVATAVGATNTVLLGNTGADPSFGTVPNAALTNSSVTLNNGNNISVTGSPLSLGGTASFDLTGTTDHALQVGNASGSLTSLAVALNGEIAIGSTGANPVIGLPSNGLNISWTGGVGTLTADLSGTTNHAVQVGNAGASLTSLAVGATNTVLLGNTGADPSFGTVPNAALTNSSITLNNGNNISVTGSPVSLGGTASFDLTGTTNHALQLGNASGSLTSLGVATDGQIPIGSAGLDPVLATITAGTNISVTNAAGSITIAANATSVTANYVSVNNGASPYTALATDYYISADVTLGVVTIRLPNAPATGRVFVIKDQVGLAATSNITVTTVGGVVLIDGAATFVMNTAYEAISVLFNGTSYEVF